MDSSEPREPDELFGEGADVIDKLVDGFQRESEKASGKRKEYLEMNQQLAIKSLKAHLYFLDQLDDSPEAEKLGQLKEMISGLESSEGLRKERFGD